MRHEKPISVSRGKAPGFAKQKFGPIDLPGHRKSVTVHIEKPFNDTIKTLKLLPRKYYKLKKKKKKRFDTKNVEV